MLPPFEIHQPATAAEAVALRARFGEAGALYAGGSELLLAMKEGLGGFAHLIDVKTITGLADLVLAPDGRAVTIGAAVTHRTLERSPLVRERLPVGVAVLLVPDERRAAVAEARVAVGCVGPVAARLPAVESALAGARLGDLETGWPDAARAGEALDAVSDLHGSADYKRAMAGVFVGRALA